MSNERECGIDIDVDGIRSALMATRELRLALEVLWGNVPPGLETEAISNSLWELHDKICAVELKALRDHGLNRQYIIVKPLNLMKPPDSETMQKITSAIQTLDDLGLIAGPGVL